MTEHRSEALLREARAIVGDLRVFRGRLDLAWSQVEEYRVRVSHGCTDTQTMDGLQHRIMCLRDLMGDQEAEQLRDAWERFGHLVRGGQLSNDDLRLYVKLGRVRLRTGEPLSCAHVASCALSVGIPVEEQEGAWSRLATYCRPLTWWEREEDARADVPSDAL